MWLARTSNQYYILNEKKSGEMEGGVYFFILYLLPFPFLLLHRIISTLSQPHYTLYKASGLQKLRKNDTQEGGGMGKCVLEVAWTKSFN